MTMLPGSQTDKFQNNSYQTNSNTLEFVSLLIRAGVDLGAMVDPCTELSFAVACRICGTCPSKEKCGRVLRQSDAPLRDVASFCPGADVLFDLMFRQPHSAQARAA